MCYCQITGGGQPRFQIWRSTGRSDICSHCLFIFSFIDMQSISSLWFYFFLLHLQLYQDSSHKQTEWITHNYYLNQVFLRIKRCYLNVIVVGYRLISFTLWIPLWHLCSLTLYQQKYSLVFHLPQQKPKIKVIGQLPRSWCVNTTRVFWKADQSLVRPWALILGEGLYMVLRFQLNTITTVYLHLFLYTVCPTFTEFENYVDICAHAPDCRLCAIMTYNVKSHYDIRGRRWFTML